uniref:Uncharacterized protein n=1 Tax=Sipha flava TaxID=143950 RepID=A0A2S2R8U7_9HEMI
MFCSINFLFTPFEESIKLTTNYNNNGNNNYHEVRDVCVVRFPIIARCMVSLIAHNGLWTRRCRELMARTLYNNSKVTVADADVIERKSLSAARAGVQFRLQQVALSHTAAASTIILLVRMEKINKSSFLNYACTLAFQNLLSPFSVIYIYMSRIR